MEEPLPPAGFLLDSGKGVDRVVAWRGHQAIRLTQLTSDVARFAARLPTDRGLLVNLCEDRYAFLVAFYGAIVRGWTNLLPPSRAPDVVRELASRHPDSVQCDDALVQDAMAAPILGELLPSAIPGERVALVAFTSGSTGVPQAHPKQWRSLVECTRGKLAVLRHRIGIDDAVCPSIVATVPPQHVYGLEMSVLLPVLGGMSVHCARPLLPGDVAAALDDVPTPRILVTTPLHVRALVDSRAAFPDVEAVVSATAPLDGTTAREAERAFDCPVLEIFGSTETCAVAHRRTALENGWKPMAGVHLEPLEDATLVSAPWLPMGVELQDHVTVDVDGTFRLVGRNADLVEVAGKRASLGDLTRLLRAVPGVKDAVVVQTDTDASGVRRIAALAVAPGLTRAEVLRRLRPAVDPVFLPRPLVLVPELPRNELGKIPRQSVIEKLRGRESRHR